jgi:hypothetical protein
MAALGTRRLLGVVHCTFASLCTAIALTATPPSVRAEIIFTFEAPNFTIGQQTPIVAAPNVNIGGPASFLGSFFTLVVPGDQGVESFQDPFRIEAFEANPLFSGNSLVDENNQDALLIQFNMPVTEVSFDWAIGLNPGSLHINGLVVNSQPQGGISFFDGGHFVYQPNGGVPFFSLTLHARDAFGNFNLLAIDNLRVVPAAIPEPSPILLIVAGLAGWMARKQSLRSERH